MKLILTLALACFPLLAAVEHTIVSVYGPKTILRGYDSLYHIQHNWLTNSVVTVGPGNKLMGTHTFKNLDYVFVSGAGAMMAGVNPNMNYTVCDAVPGSFSLVHYGYSCAYPRVPLFTSEPFSVGTPAGNQKSVFITVPLPDGVKVVLWCDSRECPYDLKSQRYYSAWGTSTIQLIVNVPGSEINAVTLNVKLEVDGLPARTVTISAAVANVAPAPTPPVPTPGATSAKLNLPLAVKVEGQPDREINLSGVLDLQGLGAALAISGQLPVLIQTPGQPDRLTVLPMSIDVSSITANTTAPTPPPPPIPGKAKWEATMLTLGKKYCNPDVAPYVKKMSYGYEADVWYYDGAWVYFQIADYTKDARWNNCALELARQYRDYLLPVKSRIGGHRLFTDGLRRAYEITGDESFKLAILEAVANHGYMFYGGVRDTVIREISYWLEAQVNMAQMTGVIHVRMQRNADMLMSMSQALFTDNSYVYQQSFWNGLMFRALIKYYEHTADPRVPQIVKLGLDYMWTNMWKDGKLYTSPDPVGARCEWGCQVGITGLINLVVPAYAWYYNLTRDEVYRQRGDEWFSHSLDEAIDFSGKVYSQNYRWSFDYVKWREQQATEQVAVFSAPAPPPPMNPTSAVKPTAAATKVPPARRTAAKEPPVNRQP